MDEQAILRRLEALEATVRELRGTPVWIPVPPPPPPPPLLVVETLPPREEPRAPRDGWTSFEQRVGKRWVTWGGSVALFVAAALFVKLYVKSGGGAWFTPPLRVAAAALFGVTLIGVGHRATRTLRVLALGLLGTGVAVLYLSAFAGLAYYHLYGHEAACVMLIGVTAVGVAVALRHDAPAIAMLAVLGALATPLLVSDGSDARDALCSYLTILDVGVLVLALRKGWRALDTVANVGTWLLFGAWFAAHFDASDRAPAMAWLVVLFAVLVAVPFAYQIRRRLPIGDAPFVLAIGNALVVLGASRAVLGDAASASWVALAMAGAYAALGAATRRRLPDDGRAIFGFITLATALLTFAFALRLEHRGLVLAWAIEGPVLCWLGLRYRYFPVRVAGLVVVALAAVKLLTATTPWLAQMCVPAAGGIYAWISHALRGRGDDRDAVVRTTAAIGSALLALGLTHLELARGDASAWIIVAMWIGGSLWLTRAGAWITGLVTAGVAAAFALLAYADGGSFALGLVAVPVGANVWRLARARGELATARAALAITLVTLWGLLSVEAPARLVTIVWGGYAIALIAAGFRVPARPFRLAGLALFAIAAGKLVVVDLSTVPQAYRVVSFLAIGLAMIAASYLYHRLERKLGS